MGDYRTKIFEQLYLSQERKYQVYGYEVSERIGGKRCFKSQLKSLVCTYRNALPSS